MKYKPHIYDPGTADEWREMVVVACLGTLPNRHVIWDTPTSVSLTFFLERPVTHYVSGQRGRGLREKAPLYVHQKKPDLDNLAKPVLDALNGVLWVDDSQVCSLYVQKMYKQQDAEGDEGAIGVAVIARTVEDEDYAADAMEFENPAH